MLILIGFPRMIDVFTAHPESVRVASVMTIYFFCRREIFQAVWEEILPCGLDDSLFFSHGRCFSPPIQALGRAYFKTN
jgi:hypothetical protein